jgi:pyruvate-formate lyase-activating enzyme
MQSGKIFDIKKYAIHDGPGIRTTIFLRVAPCHAVGATTRRVSAEQASACIVKSVASAVWNVSALV